MLRALPYIVLAVLVYLTLVYLHTYRPELLTRFLIQVDVFDLTPEAKDEHARLAAINRLPIHYEEKQVLINHTVYLGSTREMVELALGPPTKRPVEKFFTNDQGAAYKLIFFVYYLPGAKRPVIMVFQEDPEDKAYKLVNAFKGSSLEWGGN